jgi:hypothetical protein
MNKSNIKDFIIKSSKITFLKYTTKQYTLREEGGRNDPNIVFTCEQKKKYIYTEKLYNGRK